MAISKKVAEKALEDTHREAILRLEQNIDKALARGYRRFDIHKHSTLVDAITTMYRQVGWKVEVVHDQRDGDYLQFS